MDGEEEVWLVDRRKQRLLRRFDDEREMFHVTTIIAKRANGKPNLEITYSGFVDFLSNFNLHWIIVS